MSRYTLETSFMTAKTRIGREHTFILDFYSGNSPSYSEANSIAKLGIDFLLKKKKIMLGQYKRNKVIHDLETLG